jgi:hypothetical protein
MKFVDEERCKVRVQVRNDWCSGETLLVERSGDGYLVTGHLSRWIE